MSCSLTTQHQHAASSLTSIHTQTLWTSSILVQLAGWEHLGKAGRLHCHLCYRHSQLRGHTPVSKWWPLISAAQRAAQPQQVHWFCYVLCQAVHQCVHRAAPWLLHHARSCCQAPAPAITSHCGCQWWRWLALLACKMAVIHVRAVCTVTVGMCRVFLAATG